MATRNVEDDPLERGENPGFVSEEPDSNDSSVMALADHLEELRWRIVKSLLAIAIFSVVAFTFRGRIMAFLTLPLPTAANALGGGKTKLVVTGIGEGFTTYLLLALAGGFLAALPVILYQIWAFLAPGLYQHEKKYTLPFVIAGLVLFLAGLTLGYIVLRYPINWLVNFAADSFTQLISVGSYLRFVALFLLAFGLVFEIPLVLTFLSIIGLITAEALGRKRAVSHVGMWIAATLLTPGADLYSPIFLGVAMSGLFELSIICVKISQHMQEQKESEVF
ncbi:MAG TPA: twin-arginine translocase subunit TatC [Ktedonobacteraceae bacterium]|nr:twin-arginine translocase subunit TatC [Ktedonobacteraceae bacterium]